MSEHLRALALAATEGPWVHAKNGFAPIGAVETQCGDSIAQAHQVNATCDRWQRNKNAAFIAAANPAAILALLDELEDSHKAYGLLFKENAELRKDAERLDHVELFAREPDDWERKYGVCRDGKTQCWTFYAPKGAQGSTRAIIDAAIDSAAKGESNAD